MKVKCIDNANGILKLTIGKEYEVIKETGSEYDIINDIGYNMSYHKDRFEVIEEDKQQIKLQCSKCVCSPVCSEKDNWRRYCKEHIELRKKSVLFDEDPSCRYYIDKNRVEFLLAKDNKDKSEAYKELAKPYNKKVKTENGWEYKDEELNHIVEDTASKKRKLNEDEFVALLSKILSV